MRRAEETLHEIADKGFSLLRQATSNWLLGSALSLFAPTRLLVDPATVCASLHHDLDLSALNTTILSAVYYNNATEVTTLGLCLPTTDIGVPLCRVQLVVNTSDISAVTAEAWLPTDWNGRFLGLGNGGLGGCIDYDNLGYGSSMGFATIGTNNGHDGNTGLPFANNSQVLADFTTRSVHIEAVVGKRLTAAHYGRVPHHAYYFGCSTGGRQGVYSAMHNPSDFDGILAGAPAIDFNRLLGCFISEALWDVVTKEILKQCDAIDGVVDGIITEPDACDFRPEEIQCVGGSTSNCLTIPQVNALRKIYSPLYIINDELLFPRFDPGAVSNIHFHGSPFLYSDHWMKYSIRNDPNFNYSTFGLADIALSDEIDPGQISTSSGDFSAFRARGGKIISYHGRNDEIISSGNSKALYNRVSRTLGLNAASLDAFFRLFLVPGMGHCFGGTGAVNFGQHAWKKGDTDIPEEKLLVHKADNVLLSLVDWVEHGNAPDTITGVSDDGTSLRVHCRYPQRSWWNGSEYTCVA
ncbi:hypothetical protein EW145_g5797 [Phellinidium pouzarii]|uniref:Carboxylic ester hydrolase n=1 Tax=Phellinidium pouzarii TaxID=167371 RepID=A0A4S4KZD2_9AGAM|nr:hypothetical protein EW145_g5797 [Phellinidium pouzarii]